MLADVEVDGRDGAAAGILADALEDIGEFLQDKFDEITERRAD